MENDKIKYQSSNNLEKKNEKNVNEDILQKFDIFSHIYLSSDASSFVDSEESTSSTNLDDPKKKNALSLTVQNIINIYPNNEKNREFKKYKEKRMEEKKEKKLKEEKERMEMKKKKIEERRQIKLQKYKIEKTKKKLVERQKFNKENIEYTYLMIRNYFEFLIKQNKFIDIYFSFHDLYISPMRLYYFTNMNIKEIYYLDFSRKWLSDVFIPLILELCLYKKVKILNLSFNKITYKSIPNICNFIENNKYLISLNLENNDLTNDGENIENVNNFFECIKNNKILKNLNIANTNMNKKNGETLCEAIKNNTSLIELNFENNNFTYLQNCTIIEHLIKNKKKLYERKEIEKEENEKMRKEEIYMQTYLMAIESSIVEIENRERRKILNKMMYLNMWKKEIKIKKLKEKEIDDNLEKEHEERIKLLKKRKKKKNII